MSLNRGDTGVVEGVDKRGGESVVAEVRRWCIDSFDSEGGKSR
jgi:hypothetical protein